MKTPTEIFIEAEQFLNKNGFGPEIIWCENRPSFDSVDSTGFLCEYAWVVYNSGMKNSVIEAKWNGLCKAFFFFHVNQIVDNEELVRENVLKLFGHKGKLEAVLKVARMLYLSYSVLKKRIKHNTLEELDKLPFIGPITKYHLARNLGFDFVKPDRHLTNLAERYDMHPFEFCDIIHKETGRRLGVIDVVLWRFMEQRGQHRLSED